MEVWKWSWRGIEVVMVRYRGGHGEVWRWSWGGMEVVIVVVMGKLRGSMEKYRGGHGVGHG